MRIVNEEDGFKKAWDSARQEAGASFGNEGLYLEKFVEEPRHVEIQIVGDKNGKACHLSERDCSIQRRHQKLIEETPCPVMTDELRDAMGKAAIAGAEAVGYEGAGTIEFLLDKHNKFYFMEMNTRIQVEHPVTEQRTGVDLIAEMIRIAEGEKLRFKQSDIQFRGHSVECRINAEDPKTQRPSPGKILHYHRPAGLGIRVDDFIYSGYEVPPFYDSMLAKIIVLAPSRNEALDRMNRALNETVIEGISTNISLHKMIINDLDFRGNNYATNFLEKKMK
jgi:acetyl-CoA carboxylase biotin carboxylase subunit